MNQEVRGVINQIRINSTGLSHKIYTVSISDNPIILGQESITIPVGDAAVRAVTPKVEMIRCNTDLIQYPPITFFYFWHIKMK